MDQIVLQLLETCVTSLKRGSPFAGVHRSGELERQREKESDYKDRTRGRLREIPDAMICIATASEPHMAA